MDESEINGGKNLGVQDSMGCLRMDLKNKTGINKSTTSTRGQVGYWPRHRFPKGLAPDVLAAAPELEQKLFAMKKGQVSGVESAKNMYLVFHVVDLHLARTAPYAEMADKVAAEVIRQPPSKDQTALWMERLFKSKRIRYEDRYTPRNQGR